MKKYFFIICMALLLWQCNQPTSNKNTTTIVCTTSMVADAVRHIVPEKVEVISLMGPGVDPHLYKATQGDLQRLQSADVVVYNGLHLEGKMGQVLEKLGKQKTVIALSDGIPEDKLIAPQGQTTAHDPHIWFDMSLWAQGTEFVKNELSTIFPQWKEDMGANFFNYQQELLSTHNWAKSVIASLPENQRVLITAHDAFSYFGRAYGMQVRGLQGISTVSEFGLNDISKLVDDIIAQKIPAVFVESSVPKKSIEAVIDGCRQKGHDVVLGGQLYSDALGEAGTNEATLIGAFRANVQTIYIGISNKPLNIDEE